MLWMVGPSIHSFQTHHPWSSPPTVPAINRWRYHPWTEAYRSPNGCKNISCTQGLITNYCPANRDSRSRHERARKFRSRSRPCICTTNYVAILWEDVCDGSDCIAWESSIHGRKLLIQFKLRSQDDAIIAVWCIRRGMASGIENMLVDLGCGATKNCDIV